MNLLFAGTSCFSLPALNALAESGHRIAAVITRPDRPAGRGRRPVPSPVRRMAEERGLPGRTPEDINTPGEAESLAALEPDLMIVAAYGRILKPVILNLPRLGCVNVHASVLPAWRGASPVAHTLLAGDAATGVTLMQMDEGLDTGPILAVAETPVAPDEVRGELTQRLAKLGADLLARTLPDILAGRIDPVPQENARASHAPPLSNSDGHVDWNTSALSIVRRVRAFTPEPGAFTFLGQRRLLLRRVRALPPRTSSAGPGTRPGTLGKPLEGRGVPVRCGDHTALLLVRVQFQGRKEMSAEEASRGRQLPAGASFGRALSR